MKYNSPVISVIVPVYNVEQYMDKCIDSLVNQTFSSIEIILVDDGSTDYSSVKCDSWKSKDKRIKVIHKKNGGLSDARNAGIKIARGKYISFIDSDDWVDKNMLLVLYNAITQEDAELAICRFKKVKDDKSVEDSISFRQKIEVINRYECFSELLEDKEITNHVWRKLYSRRIVFDNSFPVGRNYEDVFSMPNFIKKCKKIVKVDYIGYFYRINKNGIANTTNYKNCKDRFEAYNYALNTIIKLEPGLKTKAQTMKVYQDQIILRKIADSNINTIQSKALVRDIKKDIKSQKITWKYIYGNFPRKVLFLLKYKYPSLMTFSLLRKFKLKKNDGEL